jgi:hypothetical protein
VVHGGFRRKITAKIVSDTEGMEDNPYMPVLKLILMVDLQQKVGELVLSITSCPTIISLENREIERCRHGNFNNWFIMFLLFTCTHFWVWGIL